MEENKYIESDLSEEFSLSDHEYETKYSNQTINNAFKKLHSNIEGLADIVGVENLQLGEPIEPSTMDVSMTELSRKPQKPTQEVNLESAEVHNESGKQLNEMNNLLMQWVRRLIEEKKESDRTATELMKRRSLESTKDLSIKKHYEKLKDKNVLLGKKVTELEEKLKETEIQKRSLENTLTLVMRGAVSKDVMPISEFGGVSGSSFVKEEVKIRDDEIERMKNEIVGLTARLQTLKTHHDLTIEKYEAEISALKATNDKLKSTLISIKEILQDKMDKLLEVISERFIALNGRIDKLKELDIDPGKVKIWVLKSGKEKMLNYLLKLKDTVKELKVMQEGMRKIKDSKLKTISFFRVF